MNGIIKICVCIIAVSALLLTACYGGEAHGSAGEESSKNSEESNMQNNENSGAAYGDVVNAEIVMENGGVIKLELYHNLAPITVENFVKLAEAGFYDGLIFHRVISGFMIQGGDPNGNGTGGPGYTIKGEFTNNGVENNLSHTRGVISMARQGNPYRDYDYYDTAGSQFFIMHADYPALDGNYAAFGKVTEGMDVVDAIASTPTDSNDKPVTEQKIKQIKIVK